MCSLIFIFGDLKILKDNSLMPPIDGYVTQGIDLDNKDHQHTGIDIAAKKGEKIAIVGIIP